ncbi:MAG: hypothetical protein AAF443_05995 [Chlamydiota bacterium]
MLLTIVVNAAIEKGDFDKALLAATEARDDKEKAKLLEVCARAKTESSNKNEFSDKYCCV